MLLFSQLQIDCCCRAIDSIAIEGLYREVVQRSSPEKKFPREKGVLIFEKEEDSKMRLLIFSVFILFALASAKLSKDHCTCRPRARGKIIGGYVGNQTENQHLVGILSADFETQNFTGNLNFKS